MSCSANQGPDRICRRSTRRGRFSATPRPSYGCRTDAFGCNTTSRHSAPLVFFFQAEDGIRDLTVTGVQTCALPIYVLETRFLCGSGQAVLTDLMPVASEQFKSSAMLADHELVRQVACTEGEIEIREIGRAHV